MTLFVVDPALPADPRRRHFLAESLVDLRGSLRAPLAHAADREQARLW